MAKNGNKITPLLVFDATLEFLLPISALCAMMTVIFGMSKYPFLETIEITVLYFLAVKTINRYGLKKKVQKSQ